MLQDRTRLVTSERESGREGENSSVHASHLRGDEGRARRVVKAAQLALLRVGGGSSSRRLRPDDGGELVGGAVDATAV